MPVAEAEAPVDLIEDEEGLWSLRKPEPKIPIAMEFPVKVIKFYSRIRNCPAHGEVRVIDRHFQPKQMLSIEGLSCGHTLLISRRVCGLRPIVEQKTRDCVESTFPALTEMVLNDPKRWRHQCWWLSFKQTYIIGVDI